MDQYILVVQFTHIVSFALSLTDQGLFFVIEGLLIEL